MLGQWCVIKLHKVPYLVCHYTKHLYHTTHSHARTHTHTHTTHTTHTPWCCPTLCGWYPTAGGSGNICLGGKGWGESHLSGRGTELRGKVIVNTSARKCPFMNHTIQYTTQVKTHSSNQYTRTHTHTRTHMHTHTHTHAHTHTHTHTHTHIHTHTLCRIHTISHAPRGMSADM